MGDAVELSGAAVAPDAWIRRGGGGAGVPEGPVLPAQMYRLLRGGAETLGYLQDYTVAALTELLGVL